MGPESEVLRRLEERLLQPEVRRSARDLDELLADEFVEFGGSGRVFGKSDIIESLRDEPAIQRTLTDFDARTLAPGVVLVTYRIVRPAAGQPVARSLRSSIWKLIDGRWRMVFHQGTPSDPDQPGAR